VGRYQAPPPDETPNRPPIEPTKGKESTRRNPVVHSPTERGATLTSKWDVKVMFDVFVA